jgi:hypothetical protein
VALPLRISYHPVAGKPPAAQLQLMAPEETRIVAMQAPIGWHPRDVPVWGMRRSDATRGWFVSAYSADDSGPAPLADVMVERLDAECAGEVLPPETALALRVRDAAGSFLVLTSSMRAPHLVDAIELEGPLAVVDRTAQTQGDTDEQAHTQDP